MAPGPLTPSAARAAAELDVTVTGAGRERATYAGNAGYFAATSGNDYVDVR